MTRVLVGIDAGLTSVKTVAYTVEGRAVASAARETPGRSPAPDREEQDHDALWDAVVATVGEVLDAEEVDPEAVAGVGVAGHGHGLYALDPDGEPVVGIKSTDSRALDLLEEWEADGTLAAVRATTGWEPFGADPLCLLAWLAREAPDAYDRIDRVLFCKDVIGHRLTGRVVTDAMEESVFEAREGDRTDAFERLGIADALEALPDAVPSTGLRGRVTAGAAADTGLPEGTPVAGGLHDVGACALGAGAVDPGQGVLVVGTWGQSILVEGAPSAPDAPGISRRYLDGWLTYRGTRSATACLEWFVEECAADWRREADERGIDEYALYDERVADVPPGAGGVVFHPFLRGATDDPRARAGFYGLRADHAKAHMLRAVYEGVALDLAGALDRLAPDGVADLRLTGGGARSEVWSGVFAAVTGERVRVPAAEEVGALGAALCGGVASGVYPDADAAVDAAVTVDRAHDPDHADRYDGVAEAFERAREGLGPVWDALDDGATPDG
jgi:sugar (pentulose or hexulose) kinase